MKKTMMRLAVTGLVLACATAVLAATQTRPLYVFDGDPPTDLSKVEGGIHANLYGNVAFKTGRGASVTIQVWGAARLYEYKVYTFLTTDGVTGVHRLLGTIKTNKQGVGSLQISGDPSDPLQFGHTINLWTTDLSVHLFYAHNPFWPYCPLNQ
jgi:hypothetical protein